MTNGKVLYAEVQFREGGYPYSSAYVPLVAYEYSVDGKIYKSERISFSTSLAGSNSIDAYRELLFLELSDKVKVFYKPNNPKVSVLKPGCGEADYNIYLIGLFVFLVLYFLVKLL